MSAASLDTLLACSIMVVLVLSSMVGISTMIHPFLQNQSSGYGTEMDRMMAEYLLLEPGNPSSWGSQTNPSLTSFGLAKAGMAVPFDLDIDKVTRLNQESVYYIGFQKVFTALGARDKPFRIKIRPLFDMSVNLSSKVRRSLDTVYHFNIYTNSSNLPIAASLRCYAVVGNYVVNSTASTSTAGAGSVNVTLPNTLSGTALLIAIGRVEPRTMSYVVYAFKHNSDGGPHSRGTYARLSPLDHRLRADLSSLLNKVLYAYVFAYDYSFCLSEINETSTVQYYTIRRLLDPSPMVLVGTGYDISGPILFAEWVAYPQIPLDFGSNFTGRHDVMDAASFHFLAAVNSAIYECEITIGGT